MDFWQYSGREAVVMVCGVRSGRCCGRMGSHLEKHYCCCLLLLENKSKLSPFFLHKRTFT